MNSYTRFNLQTGRISYVISGTKRHLGHHDSLIDGVYPDDEYYVDLENLEAKPKAANPTTLSGTTLSNLPLPCTVIMSGPATAEAYVEQGDLTLDADLPGRYKVKVIADHPKYYDAEFEVDL